MIEGMKMMTHWHTDSFNCCPIGDGYEVEIWYELPTPIDPAT